MKLNSSDLRKQLLQLGLSIPVSENTHSTSCRIKQKYEVLLKALIYFKLFLIYVKHSLIYINIFLICINALFGKIRILTRKNKPDFLPTFGYDQIP